MNKEKLYDEISELLCQLSECFKALAVEESNENEEDEDQGYEDGYEEDYE